MSRRANPAAVAAAPAPEQRLGAPDARSVLQILMLHAAPHLTPAEREHIGRVDECAQQMASHAAAVATGLGCLISGDVDSGNFQTQDSVPPVLWHFGELLTTIAGLIEVAGLARDQQEGGAP